MATDPSGDPLGEIARRTRDLVYIGVGLGVLGLQRLQVRRRELESSLGVGLPPTPDDLGRLFGRLPGSR
jgi:hypothetical protein